jgi:hypothetical protein
VSYRRRTLFAYSASALAPFQYKYSDLTRRIRSNELSATITLVVGVNEVIPVQPCPAGWKFEVEATLLPVAGVSRAAIDRAAVVLQDVAGVCFGPFLQGHIG